MWVFIVLLLIGCTIIVTRTFLNGAREAEPAPREVAASKAAPASARVKARPQTATARARAKAAEATSAYPPPVAEQPGGACPNCGTETVPGAKFCGECGHRLVA
jgi:predicted lipid-binding transport protein (Tim44 family)